MATVQERIGVVSHWRHRIELPDGVVTPGSNDTRQLLAMINLPGDLTGKTVLDVGCSDGFFSFECEKRGAARVLAVDDFSSVYFDTPTGFQVAHELLGSRVEFRQADLFGLDPDAIGRFDLVLFLGVLYHLRHPLLALERLAHLCQDQVIVESELASPRGLWGAVKRRIRGADNATSSMLFHESDELNHDPTNWWTPTPKCIEAMLRSCGFCGVRTVCVHRARGVSHGFAPHHGDDVPRLVQTYGPSEVATAATTVLEHPVDPEQAVAELQSAAIFQLAAIRQLLVEQASKQWHEQNRRDKA